MFKKLIVPAAVLAFGVFMALTFQPAGMGSGTFSTPAAEASYAQSGNINTTVSNTMLAQNIVGNSGEIGYRSYSCSDGCSVGCSVGCSSGCSSGCSYGCSYGCSSGCR